MDCQHEWFVFSTCLSDVSLMCECSQCGAFGIVKDPDLEEWKQGFHAPSEPYRWYDNDRVTLRGIPIE